MRVLRLARRDKPRITTQIGNLGVVLEGSESFTLPESVDQIDGCFLNGSVICVGGSRPTKTDDRFRMCRVRRVGEKVPPIVVEPVVSRQGGLRIHDPLEAAERCSRVYQRRTDVGPCRVWPYHDLGSGNHEVVTAAVAPKRIAQKDEIVKQRK